MEFGYALSSESAALPTIKGRVWLRAATILVTFDRAVQSDLKNHTEVSFCDAIVKRVPATFSRPILISFIAFILLEEEETIY